MAKIQLGTNIIDANTFISSTDATSLTLLSSGSINVGGVTSVVGSSGSDNVNLNLPLSFKPSAFTLDTFSAFNLDTKNILVSTTDSLIATSGNDVVNFTNSVVGQGVNVRYTSGGGVDTVNFQSTADKLTLATQFSGTIATGGGVDSIVGSSAVDTITLSGVSDLKYSSNGVLLTDLLTGSSSADTLTLLTPSAVSFTTNGGADSITGSYGADKITVLSSSSVTLSGGNGADNITLSNSSGVVDTLFYSNRNDSSYNAADIVTNFQSGGSSSSVDILNFSGLQLGTFNYLGSGQAFTGGFDNSEATAMTSGSNTVILIDVNADSLTDMSITLVGVTASTIDSGDFVWS